MDEQPAQLIKDVKVPIEATTEPLAGWREAYAKTKADWALLMAELAEGPTPPASWRRWLATITHTRGAFYEVFEPSRARALVKRINWCFTPRHGSWLNIAENELSSITVNVLAGDALGVLRS